MNKEQQHIINEVYRKYADSHWTPPDNPNGRLLSGQLWSVKPMQHSKESFVNECKTNKAFSEKWGLKIEERELSLEERTELAKGKIVPLLGSKDDSYNEAGIAKRVISITYKDKTIESYE